MSCGFFCWGFGLPPSEAGHVEMFATFWGGDKSSEESKARRGRFFCTGPDVITLHAHRNSHVILVTPSPNITTLERVT